MEKYYIGIDIGGMSLKGAIITSNGNILAKETITTNCIGNKDVFISDLRRLILNLVNKNKDLKIEGIGIGLPGLINSTLGILNYSPNLKIEDVNIVSSLLDINKNVKITNDANAATLGETKFGAGKGYNDTIMLTLGTGVGGGVVINGKLFEGNEGKGTELGHAIINFNGPKCGCGMNGCLEAYASASALLKQTKEAMLNNKDTMMWEYANNSIDNVNGLTSFECAKKGDKVATEVILNYVHYLSIGILNYCNIFRPECIIIGGGISNQGDYLLDLVKKEIKEANYGMKNSPVVELKIASLKNDAGVIGAASLVM